MFGRKPTPPTPPTCDGIDAGVLREMQQARERRYRTAVRFWWWVTAMLAGAVLIVIIARFFGQL